ncbi:hypothetical protein [Pseudooceanicola aestuarii]|uniref:hypothetical protein n=1 Tax=Pseudooceanicola aestuarii TaxID=2697319 RepID=UPI0013D59F21|nr:hypothetical protein [Pseudooceanicola aestuarii]
MTGGSVPPSAASGRPAGLWAVIAVCALLAVTLAMNVVGVLYGMAAGAGLPFRAGFILVASLGLSGPLAVTAWLGFCLDRRAVWSMALVPLVLVLIAGMPGLLTLAGLAPEGENGIVFLPDATRLIGWLLLFLAGAGYLFGLAHRGVLR